MWSSFLAGDNYLPGVVPRQRSSVGKCSLSSMTKNGNRGPRALIIQGVRSVIHWAHKRNDALGRSMKQEPIEASQTSVRTL